MQTEYQIRQDIVEIGRRIYQNGYVASNDGNISVRLNENEVLTTPTGVSKGYMTPDMLIKVNMKGEVLSGKLKPSSEIKMHLDVYKNRPDVRSVVHAHPPTATGFAVAGIPLDRFVLPEIIISLGAIPIAKYGTPSTEEIPLAVREYLQNHDAFLLANHGALTVGTDVFNAYYKMESMELFAKISLTARQLGHEQEISATDVGKLIDIRKKMGVQGRHPYCLNCGRCNSNPDLQTMQTQEKSAGCACQTCGPAGTESAPGSSEPDINEAELTEIVNLVTKNILVKMGKAL